MDVARKKGVSCVCWREDRACPLLMLSLGSRMKAMLDFFFNNLPAKAYLVPVVYMTSEVVLGTHSLGSDNRNS